MDEHIDALQSTESFNDRKWQVIQIVRIKKSKMQSVRIQTLDNFTSSLFGFADISRRCSANRAKSTFGGATTLFGSIGNVDFGKLLSTVPSALESNKRTPIDLLLRVANERSTTSAIQIDVRRSARALDEFLPNRARNAHIFPKPLVLFFRPSADFVEWQTVVVQHVQIPPEFTARYPH